MYAMLLTQVPITGKTNLKFPFCLPLAQLQSPRSWHLSFLFLLLLSGALSAQVGIGTTTPQKDLDVDGTFRVTGAMTLGATEITSTGAELNLLDGNTAATSTVVVGADRVVLNDDGTMKQTAMSDLLTYFAAAGAVMNTGNQTIDGVKTFSTTISGSINGNAATVTNGVYTSGNQTINGVKTFTSDAIISGMTVGNKGQGTCVAVGLGALSSNGSGTNNTAVGYNALNAVTGGYANTAVGMNSLPVNTGNRNSALGLNSLYLNTTGQFNTAIGWGALYDNTTGSNNTAIGYEADVNPGNLTNATAIGYGAVVNLSNKIVLGNINVTTVATSGTIYCPGVSNTSDLRFKKDIKTLEGALTNILKLRGTSYNWRVGEIEGRSFSNEPQIGFIAQELREIYPELVSENEDGYLSVNYSQLIPVLVEAIKEQETIIAAQQQELTTQQQISDARYEAVVARLNALESMGSKVSNDQ